MYPHACQPVRSRTVPVEDELQRAGPAAAARRFVDGELSPKDERAPRRHPDRDELAGPGTLEFVFDRHGPGTSWLAGVRVHEFLDVIGPLGTAFAYPAKLNACLLVSEGHASAPMYFLAQELRARGKRVDMIVGAKTHEHVFKPIEGKRLSQTFSIVTADGSLGERGTVLDALPGMLETTGAEVVYAAAPRPTLRAIAEMCLEREIPSQIAIEDEMPCGTGLCYTCAIPVIRKDGGGYDNLRACAEGPVFNPARILWDRWIGDASRSAPTPPEGYAKVRTWPG